MFVKTFETKRPLLFLALPLFLLLFMTGCNGGKSSGLAELKITFQNTLMDVSTANRIDASIASKMVGSTVSRIDITILETQIIDTNDKKFVISTQPQSFNLLDVTKNNPVVLAHTALAPGVYKQIRLILDPNTTITLSDGTTHPLKVPSAEQTGIKIDGIFSIPEGKLYTLDIDLDPNRSVHFAPGQGYMLKPVIAISGSEVNGGNFFFAGSHNNEAFATALRTDGTLVAKTARYPKYNIEGSYYHDGVNRKLTIYPSEVTCPDCSYWDRLKMKMFADVPPATTYDVITFAADYLDLKDASSGTEYHLFRVPTFSFGYIPPAKDFTIQATVANSLWAGKTIIAQLVPEDSGGRVFSAVGTIPTSLTPSFDFSIPNSEFGGTTRNYILLMAIVESPDDLTLRSNGTIVELKNIVAHNSEHAIRMHISRDTVATAPVSVIFTPGL